MASMQTTNRKKLDSFHNITVIISELKVNLLISNNKIQILLSCPHTFLIEEAGTNC